MLDAGVSNCAVTKQDVRNADAIFGSSIPAMKDKTHKEASTPASAVIASRVTQVQQMLAVDLFFVKKILFLLGEMVPLAGAARLTDHIPAFLIQSQTVRKSLLNGVFSEQNFTPEIARAMKKVSGPQ